MKLLRPAPGCTLIEGDCLEVLRKLSDNRVDAVVTDGPYELGFMGKAWDRTGIVNSVEFWREVLRVLKPGGHLLSFGGTRTYHRMACAIEDAGFEVRDSLHWFYGTGFPKSLNVGEGRGTALKPAHEPIVMARKPLEGTVAANVQAHGTGALNIDACRIDGGERPLIESKSEPSVNSFGNGLNGSRAAGSTTLGRWPANVLLDEDAAAELDEQSGQTGARAPVRGTEPSAAVEPGTITNARARVPGAFHADSGGASRFFYVAKPSRSERDLGCAHLAPRKADETVGRDPESAGAKNPRAGAGRGAGARTKVCAKCNRNVDGGRAVQPCEVGGAHEIVPGPELPGARNFHPTVKPIELMRYLVRLVTPPGGTVLDPFTGSGTTGCAARLEGLSFLGIEREPEYAAIAAARIAGVTRGAA